LQGMEYNCPQLSNHSGVVKVWSTIWTGDRQFHALSVFFNSLMGLEPVQQAHLCPYAGPTQDSPGLLSCLESVQALGCQELHCSGGACTGIQTLLNGCVNHCTSNLRVLRVDSLLLFAHWTVSFMVTALHNTPLQRLPLTNTGLTPAEWTALMASLKLLQLNILEVEARCSNPTLVGFLSRHQVQELRVSSDKHHSTSRVKLHPRPRTFIPSLVTLNTLAEVITTIMRLMDVPKPFLSLAIRLCPLSGQHCIFPMLIDCTEKFPELKELQITVENNINNPAVCAVPDDKRVCSAKCIFLCLLKQGENLNITVSHHNSCWSQLTQRTVC